MANTRIKAKLDGVLSPKGFEKYSKSVKKEILRAYKASQTPAIKDYKNYMGDISKLFFKVTTKNFKNMYTTKKYDKIQDRLPGVLFFTRTHYWNIFDTGGTIKPKNKKGILVPFPLAGKNVTQTKKGKTGFKELLKYLRDNKKSFWKKVNDNLILFAITDKQSNKQLKKYRKDFKSKTGAKRIKTGTTIPIAILKPRVYIRQRFNFGTYVQGKYIPTVLNEFNRNINL